MRALMHMTRDQLHASATRYYKTRGPTEPDVALVEHGAARAVFKDYGRAPGWFNRFIAPVLLWREATALAALADLAGVPQLYRRVDRRGLLIEHCPAMPWPHANPGDVAYERLDTLVTAMHKRGVAHGDLRGGGNILVDDQDRPYLVDFVSRVRRGRPWNLPWNWIFGQLEAADRSALAKLRVRYARHLATAVDYELRHPNTGFARFARRLGQRIRRGVRFFGAHS
ncbi:serine/threonine protein kinase [Salinisphaera hydrothermalis C41B8]|uniref:Serine/threonine protein kinase n=2 Tax=Salinisphaera TaxID=180541 RepID=A0A084IJA3_SALHC|nr:serine/threonine protein kinase [Salinisphaera hydrothermalis C41B8]